MSDKKPINPPVTSRITKHGDSMYERKVWRVRVDGVDVSVIAPNAYRAMMDACQWVNGYSIEGGYTPPAREMDERDVDLVVLEGTIVG